AVVNSGAASGLRFDACADGGGESGGAVPTRRSSDLDGADGGDGAERRGAQPDGGLHADRRDELQRGDGDGDGDGDGGAGDADVGAGDAAAVREDGGADGGGEPGDAGRGAVLRGDDGA